MYAIDANGCPWSSEATINGPDEFMVDAGADAEINLGDSILLIPNSQNGVGAVSFFWNPPYPGTLFCENSDTISCEEPYAIPQNTITYEVYGVDDNGCEDTDRIMIRVLKQRDVYVATGFTPNGDGKNDFLWVHGPRKATVRLFRVYDRWGNMVYEYDIDTFPVDPGSLIKINDLDFGWDGNFKDSPMNPDVYVWYAEVEYQDGFRDVFKGNTTLIR